MVLDTVTLFMEGYKEVVSLQGGKESMVPYLQSVEGDDIVGVISAKHPKSSSSGFILVTPARK